MSKKAKLAGIIVGGVTLAGAIAGATVLVKKTNSSKRFNVKKFKKGLSKKVKKLQKVS